MNPYDQPSGGIVIPLNGVLSGCGSQPSLQQMLMEIRNAVLRAPHIDEEVRQTVNLKQPLFGIQKCVVHDLCFSDLLNDTLELIVSAHPYNQALANEEILLISNQVLQQAQLLRRHHSFLESSSQSHASLLSGFREMKILDVNVNSTSPADLDTLRAMALFAEIIDARTCLLDYTTSVIQLCLNNAAASRTILDGVVERAPRLAEALSTSRFLSLSQLLPLRLNVFLQLFFKVVTDLRKNFHGLGFRTEEICLCDSVLAGPILSPESHITQLMTRRSKQILYWALSGAL